MTSWFIFDIGNTVIRIAYERVIENICLSAAADRDQLIEIFEMPGGYRDMERGAVDFAGFHEHLTDKAGYRGAEHELEKIWMDFFDGPVSGIEEVLSRVRADHRVAFLSNLGAMHAELIPRRFASLFHRDDRFIFAHTLHLAKPDPEVFRRALGAIGARPKDAVVVDDLLENVLAARAEGMAAFQFRDTTSLIGELEAAKLI
jgi:glucose-1-phosphatase